jgi:hypothetical protein
MELGSILYKDKVKEPSKQNSLHLEPKMMKLNELLHVNEPFNTRNSKVKYNNIYFKS